MRNPWLWFLPPTLIQVAVLTMSSKVWEQHLVPALRGPNRVQSDATGIVIALVVLPLLYGVTRFEWFKDMIQAHRRLGMQPPSEAEAGCAVSLVRLALVVLSWLAAWRALSLA